MRTTLPGKIGRYQIRKELGRGMMGVVYEAKDPVLGRTIALKTISLGFAASVADQVAYGRRFMAEAQAAAQLSHPGIVVVYDVGTDKGTGELFMALEYLRGTTLEALLEGGSAMDWRRALQIASRLADALHHAHSHDVVHRDIKPANIMLLDTGEPKIMDFGIAKVSTSQLTASGQIFGSPSYMSPERARELPVDARSDLFSLGAVLFELLTGRRAFAADDVASILMKVAYEDPPTPSRLVPDLPEALDGVVSRCLAKAPDDRYPTGAALSEDVLDVLEDRPPRHLTAWRASAADRSTLSSGPKPGQGEDAPTPAEGEATAKGSSEPGLALPDAKRISLAILSGGRQGDIHALDRPQILIGREGGGTGAHLELPDPQASRSHAVLECRGGQYLLRDLNSTNGTFVGDERIQDREIEDRSEFRVGHTRLMLIIAEPD